MGRTVDRTKPAPMESNYWGDYLTTATLPNAASGVSTNFLNQGDLASVLGVLYVCTTSTPAGSAVWREVLNTHSTTPTINGAVTFTGGIAPASCSGFHNVMPATATSGTDTTPADGTQFVASIFVPTNFTVTSVNYLIGSVGGTNKVYAAIYTSAGALVANSSVSGGGATVGTAANIQTLALTATAALVGPRLYYVGISMNGNTARLRTIPAHCQGSTWAGSVSQTHGTVAAITAPTTFTADKAPYVALI